MKERLYMHDGFYTSHGDTFKDVCSGIGLDKAQWKMYYDWVHEDFMRGEIFLQRDENDQFVYPDGIGFQNPFTKGSRRKPLGEGKRRLTLHPDLLHSTRTRRPAGNASRRRRGWSPSSSE